MIFGKKTCKSCRKKLDGKWNFCPRCGKVLKERDSFDEFNKEFERMNKAFGFGKLLGTPKVTMSPRGDGVSIIITQGTEVKPRIREEMPKPKKPIKIPESIEEPETKTERKGNRHTITIKLPGVKYEDIEIKRLESSVEIRAFAGDKCYFKLIPVPYNAAVNKSFEDDMLKIEVLK